MKVTSSFAFRANLKDKEINALSTYSLFLLKADYACDHYSIQRSSFN